MKFKEELNKISKAINAVVGVICVVLTALMFLSVFIQITGRYITKHGTAWTEETARYCMIWLAFLGASMLVRSGENTSVTYFKNKLPQKAQKIAELAITLVMLAFMCVISYLSITQIPKFALREFSPALGITMFIPRSSVLFGSVLVCVQLLWKTIDSILELAVGGEEK